MCDKNEDVKRGMDFPALRLDILNSQLSNLAQLHLDLQLSHKDVNFIWLLKGGCLRTSASLTSLQICCDRLVLDMS